MAVRVSVVQVGGRALFDELLVTALHGAVAFPEVNHVPVRIGDHLDFHVARMLDVFFQVDVGIAEGGPGFGLGLVEGRLEGLLREGDTHAATPAAGRGLDQDGEPNLLGDGQRLVLVFHQPLATGHGGHAHLHRQAAGSVLVAYQGHGLRGRANELDLAATAHVGEMGVLGEKSVAGMDGLGVSDFGGADDAIDFEVAFGSAGRPDAIGFVGEIEIGGAAIGFTVDGDGFDAQFAAGANDAQRNFAAVGN